MSSKGSLDKQFNAALQKSTSRGGWTFVAMPDSVRASGEVER